MPQMAACCLNPKSDLVQVYQGLRKTKICLMPKEELKTHGRWSGGYGGI
jgi:hypothetical protein